MRRLVILFCAGGMALAGCSGGRIKDIREPVETPEVSQDDGGAAAEIPGSNPARNEDWVVGKVSDITIDFVALTLVFNEGADVKVNDIFVIYKDLKELPKSRYLDTAYKQMYVGKVKVTEVGAAGCKAKVLHMVTDNPIKAGDTAIAKSY